MGLRVHEVDACWIASMLMLAALASFVAPAVNAQSPVAEWTRLSEPFDPPPAVGHQVLRDARRHRLLLLNGGPVDELWTLPLDPNAPARWERLPIPGGLPGYHYAFSAVYDSLRDRVLLFGGYQYDPITAPHTFPNDIWSLSLNGPLRWSLLFAEGGPPLGRFHANLVLDPARDRLLLYGGVSSLDFYPRDLWELDLGAAPRWSELSPAGTVPMGREGAAAIYDPWHDRMVVFGGWTYPGGIHNDTWTLSFSAGPRWDSLTLAVRPPARQNATAVVDASQQRMLVSDGNGWQDSFGLGDTWALELGSPPAWQQLPTSEEVVISGAQVGIFSPERNSVVEYGESTNRCTELGLADLRWTALRSAAPSVFPSSRVGSTLLRDPDADRLLVFGGHDTGCLNDLWSFAVGESSPWQALPTSGVAPSCGDKNVVYDPIRRRLLAIRSARTFDNEPLDQVWSMSLDEPRTWTALPVAGPVPPQRTGYSLMWDPLRDRVLLFGGVHFSHRSDDCGLSQDDLWALSLGDTLHWSQLSPVGSPGPRDDHRACYDARRDRMIVSGGERQLQPMSLGCARSLQMDAWGLSLRGDSLMWMKLGPDMPRHGSVLLDSGRDRLLLWSGDSTAWAMPLSDLREWQRIPLAGTPPTPRLDSGLLFDPVGDQLLVFAGFVDFPGGAGGAFTADAYALRFSGATGTQVTADRIEATADQVTIHWTGLTPIQSVEVRRAEGDASVTTIATLRSDALGRLSFVDRGLLAAHRYRYLLASPSGSHEFGAVTVELPLAPRFALAGARPNPAVAALSIGFSLAGSAPATLEVFDLAGRRILRQEVGAMGAGSHQMPTGVLPPGVYLVRLAQGTQRAFARAAVIR